MYSGEFHRALEHVLQTQDSTLSIHVETEVRCLTTALALVGIGLGVTAAPEYARTLAPHFGVRFLPLHGPSFERAFYVYRRQGQALSPVTVAFLASLRESLLPASRQRRGFGPDGA